MTLGRVIYWTTASLEPEYEAVSKEIDALARRFPGSMICSISPHCTVRLRRQPPALGLHPRFDLPLRVLIPIAERFASVNHVYAEFAPWTYVRSLGRRPTVITIASEKGSPDDGFLERASAIVVQTAGMYEYLKNDSRWASKLSLVFPGIDVSLFSAAPDRARRFDPDRPRILFATFPRSHTELGERGVDFLLDVAKRHPWIRLTIIGRPWLSGDTASDAIRVRLDAECLTNVDFVVDGVLDMVEVYRAHDFVVIPYRTRGGGKECPLSMVEAMACGLPVLMSATAAFSGYVQEHRCGEVFDFDIDAFGAAVRRAGACFPALSKAARLRAEIDFDRRSTFDRYGALYAMAAGHPR